MSILRLRPPLIPGRRRIWVTGSELRGSTARNCLWGYLGVSLWGSLLSHQAASPGAVIRVRILPPGPGPGQHGTQAQWPVAGRGQKPLLWEGWGGSPNPASASCQRCWVLPQAATYPEHPPFPAARFHPVPPHFILPPTPADLGMGGTGWRVPLDSAVRAGLERERSCPKMVTFIPFFKLKRGGV